MSTAVGTSTTASASYGATGQPGTSRGSKAGLEAQLDTYKKQLCDWITCASAKTPEGKKKIEELNAKVSTTESRIKELDKAQVQAQSQFNPDAATSADIQRIANATASVSDVKTVQATTRSNSAGVGPGSLVDIFA